MLSCHIDPVRRIVITRVSGRLTAGALAEYLQRMFRDPKFDPSFDSLIIAMDVEAVPSPAVSSMLAPLVQSWSLKRSGSRWAFVLPGEAARDAAELALNQVRLSAVGTRCFLSEGAALAWLESASAARKTATNAAAI